MGEGAGHHGGELPVRGAEAVSRLQLEDGGLAGHALWYRTFSTFVGKSGIWLEDLYVRPGHRRQGLASALLAHLREQTDGRLEWEVLEWNAPAVDFYQRLGARPMAGWTKYRWYEG